MSHAFANVLVHLIFATKDRLPLITGEIRSELHAYVGGMVREAGGIALIVNGTANHVHILAKVPTNVSLAECMRDMKANSSRWVHEKWPHHRDFAWQTGYGAFSVSRSKVDAVAQYIAAQEEHHKKVPFEQEFLAFLRKNGVEYDPKFLWS